jgi:hypothetical protein
MVEQKGMPRDPNKPTSFLTIYDAFFSRITDDMYMELTEEDTYPMLQDLLIAAIPRFEFPRVNLFEYELGHWEYMGSYNGIESNYKEVPATGWVGGTFNIQLTQEEINIIALNMVIEWLGQQLDTTENTKMKMSGSDFKLSSQANHMAKLKVMIGAHIKDSLHLQRLYKRRKVTAQGEIQSTMGQIMEKPNYGFKIQHPVPRRGYLR